MQSESEGREREEARERLQPLTLIRLASFTMKEMQESNDSDLLLTDM